MKIKVIDNRRSIVDKCLAKGIPALWGDYFEEASKIPHHVLCTASNPNFTFGGGIDKDFQYNFPFYCKVKQSRRFTGNERIGNICFVISVDHKMTSNEILVGKAIQFAIENTKPHETLCLTAIGTGLGLMDETIFVEILWKNTVYPLGDRLG